MAPDLRTAVVRAGYERALRPVAFRWGGGDAEAAHHAAVRAAALLDRSPTAARAARLALGPSGAPVDLLGLRFPNRVGLAAGMDKDGLAIGAWSALGFGHVELGTVTARPQPGNPRPRLFRLPASRAVVNRMGFNNAGVHALAARLSKARAAGRVDLPVGVSIGKSRATPIQDAVADYLISVEALHGLADYLAVNVSSPNTPGLRSLQDAGPLAELVQSLVRRTRELAGQAAPVPLLIKLSPDLGDAAVDHAVQVAVEAGAAGLIATNTTLARDRIHPSDRHTSRQPGGLSGAPLAIRAREVVRQISRQTDLPVIGVGGIMTADDAAAMVDAGASLVQLYTGLVYAGPALVGEVARTVSRTAVDSRS